MNRRYRTTHEVEQAFGAQVKALRLQDDVDQATLAERAAVSLSALKALEAGRGSSLRTVVRVARALDREGWLEEFFAEPTVSPLALARELEGKRKPRRASPRPRPAAAKDDPANTGTRSGSGTTRSRRTR